MGYQSRAKVASASRAQEDAILLAKRLAGLHVAVDVQHIYRPAKPADRGAVFTMQTGHKVTEAELATGYAQGLTMWLRARGAAVLTNDPAAGVLVGPYSSRNLEAAKASCDLYLACHINAGRGAYAAVEYMAASSSRPAADAIGLALVQDIPEIRHYNPVQLIQGQRGAVCVERFTGGPALLLEPFFGDSQLGEALMSPARLKAVGEAIGKGIAVWWLTRRKSASQDPPGSPIS